MRVDLFDFELPADRIAQQPAVPRDAARLLVVEDQLDDRTILDLPQLLKPGDLLVFNDTRVIPARLVGRRGAARVEVTLHQPVTDAGIGPPDASAWRAFARPARKCRPGDRLVFADDLAAAVVAKGDGGEITLAFDLTPDQLAAGLRAHGVMPLPPYIKRPAAGDPDDRMAYQTMFARHDGAVAAPTAALHFTPRLLAALAAAGIDHVCLTLHVGAGTFLPVKVADTADHRMHTEHFEVAAATADRINRARAAGARIVAVGTTVLRTLETVANPDGEVAAGAGDTSLFITPGYRFKAVDRLLTNFHLPCSTLLMLVAAFAGLERIRAAYHHAVEDRYRFFSYGDACLLAPARD